MPSTQDVTLAVATPADATLLGNLLELYLHDLSEAFPIDVGPDGRFGYEHLPRYWSETDRRFPFLIRAAGVVAGFAFAQRGSPATDDPADLDVAEFFVLRRHRRSRVGQTAAGLLWNRIPGTWVVRVSEGNRRGIPFWEPVIRTCTNGRFTQTRRPGVPHAWRVYRFEARGRS